MQLESDDLCFPQLLNSSCRKPEPPHSGDLLIVVLLSFIAVLTAVLNLLVIFAISYFRKLHTPTNTLLLSLAVSDFFVGSLMIPVEILLLRTCWFLGDLLCVLYFLLPVTIITSSVVNMVLISVDRYVAICDPLHYSTKVTQKVVVICVFLCWIYAFFYSVFLLYDSLRHPGMHRSCYGECVINISGFVDVAIVFIIPITLIICLNMRVFLTAVSQSKYVRSHIVNISLKHSETAKVKKSDLKVARTLGVLIFVFLMCYSPYYCVVLTNYNILIGSSAETYMIFLMYFNSCLNPIIYAISYSWFKTTIRLIVTFQILQSGSRDYSIM